jgi:hypothetical protein
MNEPSRRILGYARGEIEVYELSRNEFTASVRVMMFQKRIRITQKVGTEFITKGMCPFILGLLPTLILYPQSLQDAYGGCAFIRTRKGGESTEVLLDSFPVRPDSVLQTKAHKKMRLNWTHPRLLTSLC